LVGLTWPHGFNSGQIGPDRRSRCSSAFVLISGSGNSLELFQNPNKTRHHHQPCPRASAISRPNTTLVRSREYDVSFPVTYLLFFSVRITWHRSLPTHRFFLFVLPDTSVLSEHMDSRKETVQKSCCLQLISLSLHTPCFHLFSSFSFSSCYRLPWGECSTPLLLTLC
jgi:hypothetical protein